MNSNPPATPIKVICPLCLSTGHVMVNAGTGLLKKCPAKCKPIAPQKPCLP